MAVFFNSPVFTPAAASRRASVLAAPRVTRRRSIPLAATVARVAAAVGEIVFFLWTLLSLAFSLLVVAGFFA
jgi:hypothetical protein